MKMKRLGRTDMMVSELCLGTMTWGQQNTLEEGHAQMDWAQANGVNFFDVAEMYPSAPTADTCGRTEEIIGEWFTRSGKRADTILATKVAGPDDKLTWIREGKSIFDAKNIRVAIEGSLRRLQTEALQLRALGCHSSELFTRCACGLIRFRQLGFQLGVRSMIGRCLSQSRVIGRAPRTVSVQITEVAGPLEKNTIF